MIARVLPFVCIASFCLVVTAMSAEQGNELPFAPGEKLVYELSWGKIPAGVAVFEVKPMTDIDGEEAFHFVMTVRTNPFVDAVYKVRDRIDAFVAADLSRSLLYRKKQKEGSHERDIEVTFDWDKQQSSYANFKAGTLDPLSIFYAFRSRKPGNADYELPVTDGKRCEPGRVKNIKHTTIKTAAGKVKAWLLEPDMSKVGGVFKKSKNASLRVWLSDDEHRIPLRFQSKVAVGSFRGELVRHVRRDG
jgi:hypothetical protein